MLQSALIKLKSLHLETLLENNLIKGFSIGNFWIDKNLVVLDFFKNRLLLFFRYFTWTKCESTADVWVFPCCTGIFDWNGKHFSTLLLRYYRYQFSSDSKPNRNGFQVSFTNHWTLTWKWKGKIHISWQYLSPVVS